MPDHQRPLCPYCSKQFERLAVWTDSDNKTAIFFCPKCGKAFSAQLLVIEEELKR